MVEHAAAMQRVCDRTDLGGNMLCLYYAAVKEEATKDTHQQPPMAVGMQAGTMAGAGSDQCCPPVDSRVGSTTEKQSLAKTAAAALAAATGMYEETAMKIGTRAAALEKAVDLVIGNDAVASNNNNPLPPAAGTDQQAMAGGQPMGDYTASSRGKGNTVHANIWAICFQHLREGLEELIITNENAAALLNYVVHGPAHDTDGHEP